MNKRILALCICGLLTLSLTACGTSETASETTAATTVADTTTAETTTAEETTEETTAETTADISEKELAIDNADINKMIEANKLDNLLETRDSVKVSIISYDADGNETSTNFQYCDKDTFIGQYSNSAEVLTNGEYYGVSNGDYDVSLFDEGLFDKYSQIIRNDFMMSFDEHEYIASVTNADGLITIETRIDKDDIPLVYSEAEAEKFGECEAIIAIYILDENTHEIKEGASYVENADGSRRLYASIIVESNIEKMAIPEDLYNGTHGEGRTYTAIIDPDTDNERTLTTVVPKGTAVYLYVSSDYSNKYSDRECTQVIDGTLDVNSDVTIYLAKGK